LRKETVRTEMITRVFANKRASLAFCLVCLIMYTIVCVGRFSLSTAAAFIIDAGIFTKSDMGLMNGLFYAFYGVGQIVFGIMGDRFSPIKLIGIGIGISCAANFTMALSSNAVVMTVLWCLNGMGQATIFPCVINLISNMLIKEHRSKACMFLNFTYTASTLLTNISAVWLTANFTWQGIFVFAGAVLAGLLILWTVHTLTMQKHLIEKNDYEAPDDEPVPSHDEKRIVNYSFYKLLLISGLLLSFAPALLRTVISNSMTAWTPTIVMEVFDVTPAFSTTVSNIIPFFNLAGGFLATFLTARLFKNEIGTSIFFFALSVPLLFLLTNMQGLGVWLSVFILGTVYAVTNAVCQTINIMLPTHFAKFGCVSKVSGVLNAMSSAGAAISFYGVGLLADNFGWSTVCIFWGCCSLAAIVFCVFALIRWRAFDKEE